MCKRGKQQPICKKTYHDMFNNLLLEKTRIQFLFSFNSINHLR